MYAIMITSISQSTPASLSLESEGASMLMQHGAQASSSSPDDTLCSSLGSMTAFSKQ